MGFDGEAFVKRFNTVWNGHDVDGILAMMTDDVIFEASFGKDPWGARAVGTPAVREFLEEAFGYAGLDWRRHVVVDPKYFRPAEVDFLLGDAGKARRVLGWAPRMTFEELVRLMVEADAAVSS